MRKYLSLVAILCSFAPVMAQKGADPYVLVLGVAQDGGYPHMGCTRKCCNLVWQDPAMRRYVVSLALVDPAARKWWLFEATPDIKEQLHYFQALTGGRYNFLPEGIFITHAHIGHYTGLMHLGKEVMSTHDMPVYALPRLKKYLETNGPWSQLVSLHNIQLIELDEGIHPETATVPDLGNGISVAAFPVPHRDEYSETAGFAIYTKKRKYLFIPDINKWEKWDRSVVQEVKDADIALVDATFFDTTDLPARNLANVPHPLVAETRKLFANESKATKSKVYLIHFNHTNPLLWDEGKRHEIEEDGLHYAVQGTKL